MILAYFYVYLDDRSGTGALVDACYDRQTLVTLTHGLYKAFRVRSNHFDGENHLPYRSLRRGGRTATTAAHACCRHRRPCFWVIGRTLPLPSAIL